MSKALEKYRKRRFRKVVIDGEEFTIRGLPRCEVRRVEALPKDLQDAFSLALIMLEDDGSFIFKQNENETDEDFAKRVQPEIDSIPPETKYDLAQAVGKLAKVPPLDTTVKNSEGTTT